MTYHLTNSAVMTRPGTYTCLEITSDHFYDEVQNAFHNGRIKAYIGYVQNKELIRKNTGLDFKLNREETRLEDGDVVLAMVLNYRTDGIKGRDVDPQEFKFFHITYKTSHHGTDH